MSLRVYADSTSGNCLKVKWVLERLAAPYEWIEVDVMSGYTRSLDYLGINPAGQVPAVVFDDGRMLAQSNAIMLHFAEGSELVPDDRFERAKMLEWLFWEQYSHEPNIAVRRFLLRYLRKRPEDVDPKLFERGSAALGRMEQTLL